MRTPFTGLGTALVTPFRVDGSLDEAAVRRLVRRQIEVRDAGLSSNWQHDHLRSQITLERVVASRASP